MSIEHDFRLGRKCGQGDQGHIAERCWVVKASLDFVKDSAHWSSALPRNRENHRALQLRRSQCTVIGGGLGERKHYLRQNLEVRLLPPNTGRMLFFGVTA